MIIWLRKSGNVDEQGIGSRKMNDARLMFKKYSCLRLRDSLYGGRASPVWMYKKCIGKEKIYYVDFTSLYPSVQKDFKYPVSHPSILIRKECDNVYFDNLIGLVNCDTLLPKQLYFPILPSK